MNNKISNNDRRLAEDAVSKFSPWDKLWKNVKLTEDGSTYQIRIWATLRVWFTATKEILAVFHKWNHKSHR